MAHPLKIGVQLPEVERLVSWSELRDMAQAAEASGFASIWVGDHLLYRRSDGPVGPWEAWSTLAGLAEATRSAEIGPLVACTAFHNPAVLAKQVATIDEISGGRLVVGLGAGWNRPDFEAFGIPFDHRASRFEEAFTIIRGLLRDGYVDFEGRYYRAPDCVLVPRGPRPAGPPLMIGSTGRRLLHFSAPHVDSWNIWHDSYGNDPAMLPGFLRAVDDACHAAGRDPAEVERSATVLIRMPGGTGRRSGGDYATPSPPLAGAPDEVAGRLRHFIAAGVSHLIFVLDPITIESIEACAPIVAQLHQA